MLLSIFSAIHNVVHSVPPVLLVLAAHAAFYFVNIALAMGRKHHSSLQELRLKAILYLQLTVLLVPLVELPHFVHPTCPPQRRRR